MKKRIISMLLAVVMATVALMPTAFADSWADDQNKDTYVQYLAYRLFPKTQTSYKAVGGEVKLDNVSTYRKVNNAIIAAYDSDTYALGSIGGGMVSLPGGFVTIALVAAAQTEFWATTKKAKQNIKSAKDLKSNAYFYQHVYFKWTNAKQLKYKLKIETYVKYNGKVISSVSTKYKTGSFT